MQCPRCGSSLFFEEIMKVGQPDGSHKTRIYRKCDACNFECDQVTDSDALIFK